MMKIHHSLRHGQPAGFPNGGEPVVYQFWNAG